jgi:hypothetical protein
MSQSAPFGQAAGSQSNPKGFSVMSFSPPRKNLAARMGGWSAKHRWTALGLWIVFVIAAVAIGIAVGQVNVSNARLGDGESGHINRVIDDATSHRTRTRWCSCSHRT